MVEDYEGYFIIVLHTSISNKLELNHPIIITSKKIF
jgi:hypothetical protein